MIYLNKYCPCNCGGKLLAPIAVNKPFEELPFCPRCEKYLRNDKMQSNPYSLAEESKMWYTKETGMVWNKISPLPYNPAIDDKMF